MRTIEIKRDIEFEKKILLCIYWTKRKASTTEGCGPFYIRKIATPKNIHTSQPKRMFKFSPELFADIKKDLENFKLLELEMHIGEEVFNARFINKNFSISASKNKELENEITCEIDSQFKKKYPKVCPQFSRRIYTR